MADEPHHRGLNTARESVELTSYAELNTDQGESGSSSVHSGELVSESEKESAGGNSDGLVTVSLDREKAVYSVSGDTANESPLLQVLVVVNSCATLSGMIRT